jgi:tape measure domain-containing protein
MSESYSIKAILSAKDSGFSSTLKNCSNTLNKIDSKISGFSFGVLSGAGQAAFNALTNGARNLVSEIDSSNASWKTFTGNMEMLGKSEKDIEAAKKAMQSFAESSVYSSSDMATTFAQLEAVGVKGTEKLVMGFGGLAAAAENPQQAMKTLSTQATQMAAKPNVAWADFKLMLEQTPAGIAAVAKSMGMSTAEMVTAVQDGKVKTEDFLAAIAEVGTNEEFSKLATEAKTMGQAAAGLQETLANKLTPAFDLLSQKGIGAINGIADKIGTINVDDLTTKITDWCVKAQPYWEAFKQTAASVGEVLKKFGSFLSEHSDTIAKAVPYILKGALAFKAFKIVSSICPFVTLFAKSIASLAGKGISAIAGKLLGIAGAQTTVGKSSAASGKQMLLSAQAFALMAVAVLTISAGLALLAQSSIALASSGGGAVAVMAGMVVALAGLGAGMAVLMKFLAPMSAQLMPVALAMLTMGAAVVLVSTGFALLAHTSIQLANAGGSAIAVMAGMVVVIAGLAAGAALLAPALTAGAAGLIAFGAAIALVGAGALLAATALAVVSAVLPNIVSHGRAGALAITSLGAALTVFAAGAVTAGAAVAVLSASIVVFGAASVVAGAGVLAFGAGMTVAAAGTLVMVAALKLVSVQMKTIAKDAKATQSSLKNMNSSVKAVESGLNALGSKAKSAMKTLTSAFDSTEKKAKTAGKNTGKGFTDGMKSGLSKASSEANKATKAVNEKLKAGRSGAYSAGSYISKGFAEGMSSQLSYVRSIAAELAKVAEQAIRDKAKIHSPSKVTTWLGEYWGEGFVNGIIAMTKNAWNAAQNLVSVPSVAPLAFAGGGYAMSADFDYYRNNQFVIEVPLAVDGREFARATATYTQSELNRNVRRDNRKRGKA